MPNRFKLIDRSWVTTENGDITLDQVFGPYSHREAPNRYLFQWYGWKILFEERDGYIGSIALSEHAIAMAGDFSFPIGPGKRDHSLAQCKRDAAEALLTFRNAYWTKRGQPGWSYVVFLDGEILRMEDFGIDRSELAYD